MRQVEPIARGDPYAITSVGQLIDFLNGGQDAARIRDLLNPQLLQQQEIAERSGSPRDVQLTVKIGFRLYPDGKVAIVVDETLKATKLPRNEETVFITESGDMTAMNPNRGTMFEGKDLGRPK